MNKKAYILPVVNTTLLTTRELLLSGSGLKQEGDTYTTTIYSDETATTPGLTKDQNAWDIWDN